ncbi:hypothetical protein ACX80Z_13705 [Arthrobacter sp. TMT4-20]
MDPKAVGTLVKGRIVIDGRNVLDPVAWSESGWTFCAPGRRIDHLGVLAPV